MVDADSAVYEDCRDALIRYATSLVGPDKAEDVLSTVIVRVLNRRRLCDLDEPKAYLFRAVLNEARSTVRRPPDVELPTEIGIHWDVVGDQDVARAVMRLPVQQRAATYLTYWLGHSIVETAELMGVRPGSVKRYLFEARRALRKALA